MLVIRFCQGEHGEGEVKCPLWSLTDEEDDDEAECVQVNVGIGKGVAEGGVDDHEKDTAAHRPKWGLFPLQPILDVPSDDLKERHQQQIVASIG